MRRFVLGSWQEITIGVVIVVACVSIAFLFVQNAERRNDQARQFCIAIPNAAAAGATAASQALIDVIVAQAVKSNAPASRIERTRKFGAALTKQAAVQARTNARRYLPDCP